MPFHKFCRHLIVVSVVEGAVLQSHCHVDITAAAAATKTIRTHRARSRERGEDTEQEGGGAARTTESYSHRKTSFHPPTLASSHSDIPLITAFSFGTQGSCASVKGELREVTSRISTVASCLRPKYYSESWFQSSAMFSHVVEFIISNDL